MAQNVTAHNPCYLFQLVWLLEFFLSVDADSALI